MWLAPVQARILTITSDVDAKAQELVSKLQAAGLRVEADVRTDKINAKVRDAQMAKIPYALVIGRKEAEAGQVSVRRYGQQDSTVISVEDFLKQALEDVAAKR
jgi:threonyl-tRNA synthetase